jgi:flagellar biosynthesis chaperone FliJ
MAEESKLVDKLKEESSEVKFTEEELVSLKGVQQGYLECQNVFGQIAVQRLALQQQIDALGNTEAEFIQKYADNQKTEQELAKTLNEKYGAGNLDPETGVFSPNIEE